MRPIGRRSRSLGWLTATLLLAAIGCADAEKDYGDPTANGPAALRWEVIAAPPATAVDVPVLDLALALRGQGASDVLAIRWSWGGQPPGAQWIPVEAEQVSFDVSLLHGDQELSVQPAGILAGPTLRLPFDYQGDAPGLRVDTPAYGSSVVSDEMPLRGLASALAPARIVAVEWTADAPGSQAAWAPCSVRDDAQPGRVRFEASVSWPAGVLGEQRLTVRATDDAGRHTQWSTQLRTDASAPSLTLFEPAADTIVPAAGGTLAVHGAALDDVDIDVVRVGWAGEELPAADGTSPFAAERVVPDGVGPRWLQVQAVDRAGRTTSLFRRIWAPSRITVGWARPAPSADMVLELSRAELATVLPADGPEQIVLFCLDMKGVVRAALDALATPDAYGMDLAGWPPLAVNMQKLLAMSPATAEFSGTALQSVMYLAEGLGMFPASLLSELLQLDPHAAFLATDTLTDALYDRLVLTHPALSGQGACGAGELEVSLADALSDMATLESKLGPAGEHPGLVAGPPRGVVLGSTARMTLTATSRLVGQGGIDLQTGALRLYAPAPGEAALDFDFSEAGFSLTGLTDYPRVDLDFQLTQAPGWVAGGTPSSGPPNPGEFPTGDGAAWNLERPWWLEAIVVDAAYREFSHRWADEDFVVTLEYGLGELQPAAVMQWNQGWLDITTAGDLGAPPPPAYLWDTLLEVAQVRLGDPVGAVSPPDAQSAPIELPLRGVPMPVTGADVAAQVPEKLAAQSAALSELIIGTTAQRNTAADVLVLRTDGGGSAGNAAAPPALDSLQWRVVDATWAGAKTPQPKATTLWADAALSQSWGISRPISLGEAVYLVDEQGGVWRLRALAVGAEGLDVELAPVTRPEGER